MSWFVIVIDMALLIAAIIALWSYPLNPIVWIIVIFAFLAWRDSGGGFAWKRDKENR